MSESDKTGPRWSIREYREGDEKQIRELRGLTFHDSRDDRWFQWMYKNNPAGPAVIWLAEINRKIIGHNGQLPLRIKFGNKTNIGALGFDFMTHPDYQRQGILTKIRAKVYQSAVENDIKLTFGSALPRIFPVYTKLHSFFVCEPPMLVKIISMGKVLKRRFKIPAFIGNIVGHFLGPVDRSLTCLSVTR